MELRFWIDVRKRGIPPRSGYAPVRPPVSYPVELKVSIYAEDFLFSKYHEDLTLNKTGASKHARFAVLSGPAFQNRGEAFIFIQHKNELVAAFRVEALVSDQQDRRPSQELDYLYLATDWFEFPEARGALARTILFTKKEGNLQIFTLKAEERPWATLGTNESGLYEHNKAIYEELHRLALRAAEAAQAGEVPSFAKEFNTLAERGHQLFTDLFCSNDAPDFYERYLKDLPIGSPITVVTTSQAQNLYIPWGFLYEIQPPFSFSESPERSAFWGYRYDLIVRPSVTPVAATGPAKPPVRVGAAWLTHPETQVLRRDLEALGAGRLVLEDIRVEHYCIPALAEREFDLVEFFCHGHTQLTSVFTPEEAGKIVQNYADSTLKKKAKKGLLMAIESSSDSLVELNGGFATLSTLRDTLKNGMRGGPLILLSMCESAQVSASGGGFVALFLQRGARAVIGTEGPTLWSLSRDMDTGVIRRLLEGASVREAFYETRQRLAETNMLALIYTLYGDPDARLVDDRSESNATRRQTRDRENGAGPDARKR